MLQTEHSFTLPCGYQDAEGTLHRNGVMRMATAADEILPRPKRGCRATRPTWSSSSSPG